MKGMANRQKRVVGPKKSKVIEIIDFKKRQREAMRRVMERLAEVERKRRRR
jgi:hypothetical protein